MSSAFRALPGKRQRGAIAVELAMIAIPLVLISLMALEFGRAMYTYNTLVKLTRDGARFLSGFDPSVPAEYPTGIAINRMLCGKDTACSDADILVPGLDAGMIRICDRVNSSGCPGLSFGVVPTGTGSINLVRVAIEGFVFTPAFPGASGWASITFDTIGTTMRQVL